MGKLIKTTIPTKELETLDKTAAEEGITRNRLIRKVLKRYIRTRQLEMLRMKGVPLARSMNVNTDKDVFNCVS